MNTLFELPENKSPRLKWIEKHGIKTARIVYFVESGREPEWNAWASSQGETLKMRSSFTSRLSGEANRKMMPLPIGRAKTRFAFGTKKFSK